LVVNSGGPACLIRRPQGLLGHGGSSSSSSNNNSSSSTRKRDSIKRDIIATLLSLCISFFVRFLWLALTIVGDFLAAVRLPPLHFCNILRMPLLPSPAAFL